MFDDLNVAFKAQGIEESVKVSALPESTIIAALTYGLRRMIQDSVNNSAKELRDADGREDITREEARTLVDARVGALMDGTVGTRAAAGPAVDSLHKITLELTWTRVVKPRLAKVDVKRITALKAKERLEKCQGWFDGLTPDVKEGLVRAAKEEQARRAERTLVDVDLGDLTFEV